MSRIYVNTSTIMDRSTIMDIMVDRSTIMDIMTRSAAWDHFDWMAGFEPLTITSHVIIQSKHWKIQDLPQVKQKRMTGPYCKSGVSPTNQ